jgi:hypothetical protein
MSGHLDPPLHGVAAELAPADGRGKHARPTAGLVHQPVHLGEYGWRAIFEAEILPDCNM